MSTREKLRAETRFRKDPRSDKTGVRASVPAEVRDYLGAKGDDRIIFEDGCEETVRRAALGGSFVVVRRATRPGEARQLASVRLLKQGGAEPEPAKKAEPAENVEPAPERPEPPPAPAHQPFEEFVRSRCGRAGRVDG